MSIRKPFKLDQLGSVGRGKSRHRPRNDPRLYGGQYPFFQTGDVKDAELYLRNYTQTYNEQGLAQSKLWPVGTLCITIAANIADTAILAIPGCFPDSIVGFIADPKKSDARFVKYYIETLKLGMQNVSRGTTQDNLSLDKLTAFDFVVPDVDEQRRIASILSAYDDLIENNARRILILEEMARRIHEEWFVHFRFPGHESVGLVASELGSVPKTWFVGAVGQVFKTVLGGTPARGKPEYWEAGTVPWINSGKVNELRIIEPSARITELALAKSAAKLMPAGTTVIAITGATLGQVSMLGAEMCANQSVVGIYEPSGHWREFLFWSFKTQINSIIQRASGGAQQHINKDVVNSVQLVLPDGPTLERYTTVVRPINDLVLALLRKNQNLRSSRDLLLPKLISGEIEDSSLSEPETAVA